MIIVIANLIIGVSIGISGIGGFFLPVIYTAILNMSLSDALMLSFCAFIVSGIVGSVSYGKLGYIKYKFALILGIGCFVGAVIGVNLSTILPKDLVKTLLYCMVLLAGISLLVDKKERDKEVTLLNNKFFLIVLGICIGIVCSITGAGGALILVPLLAMLGMPIKFAVGISILESVFIAIPSSFGYFVQSGIQNVFLLILAAVFCHGIGVFIGSKIAYKVNQKVLKTCIAYLSIVSAIYLFITK